MKRIIKYAVVAVVAIAVVLASALLPPYLAKKNDAAFLDVISKDEQVSKSYEYKATKYQKTKVLYEVCNYNFDYFRGFRMMGGQIYYEKYQQEQPVTDAQGAPAELPYSQSADAQVRFDYGETPARDAVMTKKEAELAIVREARLLQSTGAIPKFEMGELGSAEVVKSISFWSASDPTVSNQEFYYWEGLIFNSNTGDSYNLIIDDDLGQVYFMHVEYAYPQLHVWGERDVHDQANAFAVYHELYVEDLERSEAYDIFGDYLYSTTDSDYEVLVETEEDNRYKMILKPSDIL